MGLASSQMNTVLSICRSESADCSRAIFGDDKPAHTVYLDTYEIGRYEVTNAQFAAFVADTDYVTDAEAAGRGQVQVGSDWEWVNGADWRHPEGSDSDIAGRMGHPVVQVSWNDANTYCEWANGRLPTDAEWEKAARGPSTGSGDGRIYPWGDNFRCDGANLDDETTIDRFSTRCDDGWFRTAPVGSFPDGVSPYGLFDMAGNVREWVSDWYDSDYYESSPRTNPAGPSRGQYKSTRGGSWFTDRTWARVTDRRPFKPDFRSNYLGFRCARDVN